ncbi:hypothetical protein [Eikenella corrodens]|uniref:hypothetical protein n=1 Tax=Eikenella corrodens TaxID=539 RepID=UPI00129B43B2|nr:hypothetical protein [Eikenella corrodens]
MKIVEISFEEWWTNDILYSYGEEIIKVIEDEVPESKLELVKGQFLITEFGKKFAQAIGILS